MLIGGLSHYAPSLTAFGNMVSSSYLRLVPNQEAPTKVCWSEMNRNALIRVPLAWSKGNNFIQKINPQQSDTRNDIDCKQTVELRSPDGSCNAHLLLAGISLAAEWGIKHEREALDMTKSGHVTSNIHTSPDYNRMPELPTSCVESSEVLLKHRNDFERDGIFPQNVITHFADMLQNENDRNLNKRLMALADEEKIYESRRLMHRNIHMML
jgi:glutamine synthetase